MPSSREDVDRDSSWNQWLRNEIHTLFIEALEVFKVKIKVKTENGPSHKKKAIWVSDTNHSGQPQKMARSLKFSF